MAIAGTAAITELWAKCKAWFATKATASTTSTTASIQLKNSADTALGSAATIPAATTSAAGVMTADDKTKLNGIATGATANAATTTTPKMDGTAAVGSETAYAKGDHVHPTDTSRVPTTRTVNGKALSADISITPDDIVWDAQSGQTPVMLSQKISDMDDATDGKVDTTATVDGVEMSSANVIHFGTCGTTGSTAAKTVSITGFKLKTGARALVKFTNSNTAAPANLTLNVSSTGAKAIKYHGTTPTDVFFWSGYVYEFVYDGTNWEVVGGVDTNTTYAEFQGPTAGNPGFHGLVPGPAAEEQAFILVGDGDWTDIGDAIADAADISEPDGFVVVEGRYDASTGGSHVDIRMLAPADIPSLAASKIGSGTFDAARIPDLAASKITSGTFDAARIPSLAASKIGSGTLDAARLPDASTSAKGAVVKDSSISAGSSSTNVPTSAAVASFVAGQLTGATAFQGTVNSNSTISDSSYVSGYYWVVATAGTYVGQSCEVGDMVFAISDKGASYAASDFSVVQNNVVEMTAAEVDAICV